MFQYRQVLVRMRRGDSDRDIARSRLMGRRKVAGFRALAGCHPQIPSEVGGGAQKYSWCKPPSTELARTATSSHKRWRDVERGLIFIPGGGSGTPGPNAMCGRTVL